MKHLLYVVVIFMCFNCVQSSAQGFYRVSARAGAGYSLGQFDLLYRRYDPISESYSGFGYYVGGAVEFVGKSPTSKSRFQIDLNYNYNVLKDSDQSLRLVVFNLPLLYKYYVTPRLNFTVGAALGISLINKQRMLHMASANGYAINRVQYYVSNMKFFQPSAVLGISYYISERVYLDLRYNLYFGNRINEEVYDNSKVSLKYNTLQFGIAYSGLLSNKTGRYFPPEKK